jgi:3-hydroxybutyryl-CoA dehydrogenase
LDIKEKGMNLAGFEKVAVIGAGQMGAGIAQVCATAGLEVKLYDLSADQREKARKIISGSVNKLLEKGKITAEAAKQASQVKFVDQLAQLSDVDLVIEAIVENETIKASLFRELDGLMKPDCVFASNTSSIPITRLAAATKRPERFVGMHFMNPVPLMQLVEVISGMATLPEITQRIISLSRALGKEVSQSKDFPGFVVNRILMPMINEAFNTLMEGIATAEDIDKGMKLGTNQPMGPLALADFIGLDTCLAIVNVLYDGTLDPRFRPSPLLRKYVEAGYFGRKAGRGVYSY